MYTNTNLQDAPNESRLSFVLIGIFVLVKL